MRRMALLAMFVCFGCKSGDAPKPANGLAPTAGGSAAGTAAGGSAAFAAAGGSAAGSSAPTQAGTDPWSPRADPDAPPSLMERATFANEACPTVKAPYFFEVTTKSGKVSHLLGTRHVSVPLSKFPEAVRTTINSAKLAVFEVAPDDHGGTRSHDEAIRDKLGPADWKHLQDLVGKEVANELAVAPPSAAAVSMMVLYEDVSNMLDKQIEDVVASDKIPARGLETAAFQDRVLDHLLDMRMLKATIEQTKDRAEIKKQSKDDLGSYCAGTDDSPGMDEDSRAKMLKAGYTAAELDAMDEELVFSRNRSWIPQLETLFEQGDVFVAVGADHLIGQKGVPALLQARGMKVKRLTPP